jgi:hypothetical protein
MLWNFETYKILAQERIDEAQRAAVAERLARSAAEARGAGKAPAEPGRRPRSAAVRVPLPGHLLVLEVCLRRR